MTPGDKSNERPLVSVIIPVFNVEAHLRETLDSAVKQTLREIEIICVEDGSTDSTRSILEDCARRDPRIKLIVHDVNRGTFQSRKDGVLAAAGEYILFLDGDDYLEPEACEKLYAAVRELKVDILHFGTEVINAGGAPERQLAALETFIRPHAGRIEGDEVFTACFLEGKFQFTIWNKLYAAELCQTAYRDLPDDYVLLEEDLYAFFAIAYYARSYVGLADACWHHYRYGSGLTGRPDMTLDRFTGHCAQAGTMQRVQRWIEARQAPAQCQAALDRMRRHLLEGCVRQWLRHLPAEDRARGFDLLVEHWGAADTISALARLGDDRQGEVAEGIRGAAAIQCRPRPVKTIGVFHLRMYNGGVERAVSNLVPLWIKTGYRVVLFTDEPPNQDDYPLPETVLRVVLPAGDDRPRKWAEALEEHPVDAMVYHAWVSPALLWDLLAVKSCGIPIIINAHGVFSFLLIQRPDFFAEMARVYSLCDAVAALSAMDREYWKTIAPRAVCLPLPLAFDLEQVSCSDLESHDVLWVGRISPEKNPRDAIRIMAHVVAHIPDARLHMLGKGGDEKFAAEVEAEIDQLGLRDHVLLCGYHRKVDPFYRKASVFLMTSRYEGFSLGLAEARAHGLPCVMYELPHLELCRDSKGILAAGQGEVAVAAKAVVSLLRNDPLRKQTGREARRSIEEFTRFDLAKGWRELLDSVAGGSPDPEDSGAEEGTVRMMLRTLLAHFRQGRERVRQQAAGQAARIADLTRQRDEGQQRLTRLLDEEKKQRARQAERIADLTRQRDAEIQKRTELARRLGERRRQRDAEKEKRKELARRLGERRRQRDAARRQRDELKARVQHWKARCRELAQRRKNLKANYEQSLSWKITAPLRALGRWRKGGS